MRPDHRAQLAAAIAQFQADIRRLAQAVRPQDRDRLLATLEPTPARGAARTRKRAAAATRGQPAARAGQAAARAPARQPAGRRTRKAGGAAKPYVEPTVATSESAPAESGPPAEITTPAATESGAGPVATDRAATEAATAAVPRAESAAVSGSKRVRWTREAIIEELARWMVTGTSIDSAFVKRHGPPGLVTAARRTFGRFDAALNVAGLHVAKLYPDGPPAR